MLNPGQVLFMTGVEWEYYEYLRDVAPNNWKITYAYGDLQVVAPTRLHERHKCRLGGLIERALEELDIKLWEDGSTTLKIPDELGGEPDESFCIGVETEYPHIVIESEVTSKITSGKLELYQRIGVSEIWKVSAEGKIVLLKSINESWVQDEVSSFVPVRIELFEQILGANLDATAARKRLVTELRDNLNRHV